MTEVVSSDDQSTITYANDGSKNQGAGSFTVQGIIINGKYRALPTMSIASESKPNLAELKLTTYRQLVELMQKFYLRELILSFLIKQHTI